MDNALADDRLDGVRAPLRFTATTGKTPIALVKAPGAGLDERTGTFERHDVFIHDGRPLADRFDLDSGWIVAI